MNTTFMAFIPLIFWAVLIFGIVLEVKAVKKKQYRPFYKIGWFYIAIACILLFFTILTVLPLQ